MKRLFLLLILIVAVPSLVLAQGSGLSRDQIARVSQSAVQIVALDNGEPFSQGSGTVVDPSGFIFTNVHVIEGSDDLAILMLEDTAELPVLRYFATPVQVFEDYDFAVLQIDRDADGRSVDPEDLNLPFINLAEENVQLGDPIFVFGYPGIGDGYLVFTDGTVTTIQNQDFGGGTRLPYLYQTNAEISPGNSGGTAVNAAGEFIGIPTVVRSEERTGGRLGGIVTLPAIRFILDMEQPSGGSGGSGGGGGSQEEPDLPDLEDAQPTPVPDYSDLDPRLQSNYGGIQLEAGFEPDPWVVPDLVSGVAENASVDVTSLNLGESCLGFATPTPDYKILWTGGSQGFRVFFYSPDGGDTTMIINMPDGSYICSDDSFGTLNPSIDIIDPEEGEYNVWVGSYSETENVPGYLAITEVADYEPSVSDIEDILQDALAQQQN